MGHALVGSNTRIARLERREILSLIKDREPEIDLVRMFQSRVLEICPRTWTPLAANVVYSGGDGGRWGGGISSSSSLPDAGFDMVVTLQETRCTVDLEFK